MAEGIVVRISDELIRYKVVVQISKRLYDSIELFVVVEYLCLASFSFSLK